MATKNHQLLLSKQDYFNDFKDNGSQYSNLNLNQTFSNEPSFVQSKSKSSNNNNRFELQQQLFPSDNTVPNKCHQEKATKNLCSKPLELLSLHDKNEDKKEKEEAQKRWMKNSLKNTTTSNSSSSTLSLHIAAYENAMEEEGSNKKEEENETKKFKKTKNMMDSVSKFENSFETPRQMVNREASTPQVMQFKASQRLLNPNQSAAQTPQQQQQNSFMKQNTNQRNVSPSPSSRQQRQQPPSTRASGQIAEAAETIIRSERPIREIDTSLSGEGVPSLRSKQKINPAVAKALEEIKAWFHGKMDRFKASKLLKNDGDFLIRLGKSMDDLLYKPVLSVKWGQRHYHFLIKELNSLFWIEKSQFASIASLVRYYLNTKKPITQNSGVILGTPIISTKFIGGTSANHDNNNPAMAREKRMLALLSEELGRSPNNNSFGGGVVEATRSLSYAILGENAPFILQTIGKIAVVCAVIIFLYICTVF